MAYYNIKNFRRTLPVATSEVLGCVKLGDSFKLDREGSLESPSLNNLVKIMNSIHFNKTIIGGSGSNLVFPYLKYYWDIENGEFLGADRAELQPGGFISYPNPVDVYDSNLEPNYNIKIKYSIAESDLVDIKESRVHLRILYDTGRRPIYNYLINPSGFVDGVLEDGYYHWEFNENFFLTDETMIRVPIVNLREVRVEFDIFGESHNPHIIIDSVLLQPGTCTSDDKRFALGIEVFG